MDGIGSRVDKLGQFELKTFELESYLERKFENRTNVVVFDSLRFNNKKRLFRDCVVVQNGST